MADPIDGTEFERGQREGAEYRRGQRDGEIAGQISARLADHDRHFATINGSIEKLALAMGVLNQGVERTAIAAEALKGAAAVRWSLWEKAFAAVVALSALGGLLGLFFPVK